MSGMRSSSEKRQRTALVAVRFLPAEYAVLSATAGALKISVSQLVRSCCAEAIPELNDIQDGEAL